VRLVDLASDQMAHRGSEKKRLVRDHVVRKSGVHIRALGNEGQQTSRPYCGANTPLAARSSYAICGGLALDPRRFCALQAALKPARLGLRSLNQWR